MQVSTGVLASCSPPHRYRVSPITLTPCEDLCEQYHYRVFHIVLIMAPGHGPAPLRTGHLALPPLHGLGLDVVQHSVSTLFECLK